MATVALSSSSVLSAVPFFISKLVVTGGTTAAALAHGCPREPDIVIPVMTGSPATNVGLNVVSKTATTVTLDSGTDDAALIYHVYCICFHQA